MRIIISGGTGLIGMALAKDLAKDGHELILLTRTPKRTRQMPEGIRLEPWDGRTAQGWGKLVDGAGAIVNLSGENLSAGRWTAKRKQTILDSRTLTGAAIVQAIREAEKKPQVLIQGSAVGYYGPSETALFSENDPPANDFMGSVVQAWEASTQAVEELGVRRAVVRMGVVFSTQSGALPRMLLPFRLFAGGPLGSGKQPMSWAHLDDIVRALRFLIDHEEARGVYNIAAEPLTNRQLAKTIGKVMHRPAFFSVPGFIIQLLFGEMSTVVLDGQRVSAKRLTELGFRFRFPDAESALRDLLHSSRAASGNLRSG